MNEIENNIVELIVAYIDNSISENQFKDLTCWLNETEENKKMFSEYLLLYKKSRRIGFIDVLDKDKSWEKLEQKIKSPINTNKNSQVLNLNETRSIYKRMLSVLKYAAVLLVLIGSVYFIQTHFKKPVESKLVISEEDIVLKLSDGTIKVIASDGSEKVVNDKGEVIGNRKGNALEYTEKNRKSNKIEFNELVIPFGKTFDLVLSDGTKVKLNSGSSLKYPVNFINGKNRKVFLTGEAFFDVASDVNHPFIVSTQDINVKVLGTQFNVSSYGEDSEVNTVLIEGSVKLLKHLENDKCAEVLVLKPGFEGTWDKDAKSISVGKADVSMKLGWMQGKLIFKNTPFKNIRKKLERKYNIIIENKNLKLDESKFNAVFDIETIQEVMEILDKNYGISYKITENKIIIN